MVIRVGDLVESLLTGKRGIVTYTATVYPDTYIIDNTTPFSVLWSDGSRTIETMHIDILAKINLEETKDNGHG